MANEDSGKGPAQEVASNINKETGEKTVWTPKVRRKFETKSKSEYLDPCQEAAARSIRCLHRNGGDKAMCQDFFEAYRACKKDWITRREEDKAQRRRESGGGWFS